MLREIGENITWDVQVKKVKKNVLIGCNALCNIKSIFDMKHPIHANKSSLQNRGA